MKHFGTSVCLFHDNFFVSRNASYRDAGFRTRQSAFKKHISFPVMQFLRADATVTVLCLTSPKHCPKYVTDYPYCSVILEVRQESVMATLRTNLTYYVRPRFVYVTFKTLLHYTEWCKSHLTLDVENVASSVAFAPPSINRFCLFVRYKVCGGPARPSET